MKSIEDLAAEEKAKTVRSLSGMELSHLIVNIPPREAAKMLENMPEEKICEISGYFDNISKSLAIKPLDSASIIKNSPIQMPHGKLTQILLEMSDKKAAHFLKTLPTSTSAVVLSSLELDISKISEKLHLLKKEDGTKYEEIMSQLNYLDKTRAKELSGI